MKFDARFASPPVQFRQGGMTHRIDWAFTYINLTAGSVNMESIAFIRIRLILFERSLRSCTTKGTIFSCSILIVSDKDAVSGLILLVQLLFVHQAGDDFRFNASNMDQVPGYAPIVRCFIRELKLAGRFGRRRGWQMLRKSVPSRYATASLKSIRINCITKSSGTAVGVG